MTEIIFLELDNGYTYVRTDSLFAALNQDYEFFVADGQNDLSEYVQELAERLMESIMKREE